MQLRALGPHAGLHIETVTVETLDDLDTLVRSVTPIAQNLCDGSKEDDRSMFFHGKPTEFVEGVLRAFLLNSNGVVLLAFESNKGAVGLVHAAFPSDPEEVIRLSFNRNPIAPEYHHRYPDLIATLRSKNRVGSAYLVGSDPYAAAYCLLSPDEYIGMKERALLSSATMGDGVARGWEQITGIGPRYAGCVDEHGTPVAYGGRHFRPRLLTLDELTTRPNVPIVHALAVSEAATNSDLVASVLTANAMATVKAFGRLTPVDTPTPVSAFNADLGALS